MESTQTKNPMTNRSMAYDGLSIMPKVIVTIYCASSATRPQSIGQGQDIVLFLEGAGWV